MDNYLFISNKPVFYPKNKLDSFLNKYDKELIIFILKGLHIEILKFKI